MTVTAAPVGKLVKIPVSNDPVIAVSLEIPDNVEFPPPNESLKYEGFVELTKHSVLPLASSAVVITSNNSFRGYQLHIVNEQGERLPGDAAMKLDTGEVDSNEPVRRRFWFLITAKATAGQVPTDVDYDFNVMPYYEIIRKKIDCWASDANAIITDKTTKEGGTGSESAKITKWSDDPKPPDDPILDTTHTFWSKNSWPKDATQGATSFENSITISLKPNVLVPLKSLKVNLEVRDKLKCSRVYLKDGNDWTQEPSASGNLVKAPGEKKWTYTYTYTDGHRTGTDEMAETSPVTFSVMPQYVVEYKPHDAWTLNLKVGEKPVTQPVNPPPIEKKPTTAVEMAEKLKAGGELAYSRVAADLLKHGFSTDVTRDAIITVFPGNSDQEYRDAMINAQTSNLSR